MSKVVDSNESNMSVEDLIEESYKHPFTPWYNDCQMVKVGNLNTGSDTFSLSWNLRRLLIQTTGRRIIYKERNKVTFNDIEYDYICNYLLCNGTIYVLNIDTADTSDFNNNFPSNITNIDYFSSNFLTSDTYKQMQLTPLFEGRFLSTIFHEAGNAGQYQLQYNTDVYYKPGKLHYGACNVGNGFIFKMGGSFKWEREVAGYTTKDNNLHFFGLSPQYSILNTNGAIPLNEDENGTPQRYYPSANNHLSWSKLYLWDDMEYTKSMTLADLFMLNADKCINMLQKTSSSYMYYVPESPKLQDGNWKFNNILVTENYESALKYIEDGTIPDDGKITVNDGDGNIIGSNDEKNPSGGGASKPTQNENGNSSSSEDGTPVSKPNGGSLDSGTSNYYIMSESKLKQFINWFWNDLPNLGDLLLNVVTGLYSNLSQCIMSISYVPFSTAELCETTKNGKVIIGRYESEIEATLLIGEPSVRELGVYEINEYYNSFADYLPYTHIFLYLPYYGFKKIDTNVFMNSTLKVRYSYDISCKSLTYMIFKNESMIESCATTVGQEIPFTLDSMLDNASNTVNKAVSVGADVGAMAMTGIPNFSAITDVIQPQYNDLDIHGNVGQSTGLWCPQKCAIIIKRPNYKRPSNYGARIGYPVFDSYKLSSLSGFTVCQNPSITSFSSVFPVKSEYEEIISNLEKGVIL